MPSSKTLLKRFGSKDPESSQNKSKKEKRWLDASAFLVLKIIVAWSLRPGHFEQKAVGLLELEGRPEPVGPMGPAAQLLAAGPQELEAQPKTDSASAASASAAAVAEAPADSRAAAELATPAGTAEVADIADIAGAAGSHRLPLAQLHRPYERD